MPNVESQVPTDDGVQASTTAEVVNGRERWLVQQLREKWRQSRGSQLARRILNRELVNGSELSLSLSGVECWRGYLVVE